MQKARPTLIVNLDDFDNKILKKRVKPATQRGYDKTLAAFDQFVLEHSEKKVILETNDSLKVS